LAPYLGARLSGASFSALERSAWSTSRIKQFSADDLLALSREEAAEPPGEEVRLDELARLAGVHPAHLNRVFRRQHGCAVGEYVRRLRIDLAARELAGSQRPIADIAAAMGFADQSHFSRVFARVMGMTPGRYRKLHGSHG
jgi:AraC family transcriptional regulator